MNIHEKLPRNQVINTDNRKGLKSLPDDSIPLTVTSPPWDDVRIYGDGTLTPWNANVFREVADQLWRVTAQGGVVCWHVGEQIQNGSESGTSSEQRLYFRDLGFRLWQTLIVETMAGHTHGNRYGSMIQYIFVLAKGPPKTVHLLRDRPNKHAGEVKGFNKRRRDGSFFTTTQTVIAEYGIRGSVWKYHPRKQEDDEARRHPAPMDETISRDLIRSFSNPGDLVLDPFAGSGTTLKWVMTMGRYYLGFEAVEQYFQLAKRRLERYRVGMELS
ncbi:DNA-methyltransferase [Bremerella alba]|uniref:Methyltransferase n=1 Tax=Bremerella alba TaxID=980252 RepID=A0A7V8V851_9BACT|nr:site-specific DNA-methyltransferase [Bremerella alba]MBA2116729.1 DNA adenine methyltransferase YhdJ [Bremerella alba]